MVNIVDFELRKVRERLSQHDLGLELDESARAYLIDKGFNPDFGARPLRRAIEQDLEDLLSEAILRGEFKPGQIIIVRRDKDSKSLQFDAVDPEPEPAEDTLEEASAEST